MNVGDKILAVLFILSILTNIYLIQVQPSSKDLLGMKDKINQLEITNSQMSKQIYRDNLSIQNYASQLDLYRCQLKNIPRCYHYRRHCHSW